MVQVRVNPTCKVYWDGAEHGAGAELAMPSAVAHQKEKEGAVIILNAPRKTPVVQKEIEK